jgi:hypothetical protein
MINSSLSINTGIVKNNILIQIESSFKDEFTDDVYFLESFSKNHNMDNLSFLLLKNGKEISKLELKNKNIDNFLKEVYNKTNDFDFNNNFKKKHASEFSEKVSKFLEQIDSSVVVNGKLMEGYKSKMRMMSGIQDLNKNIR